MTAIMSDIVRACDAVQRIAQYGNWRGHPSIDFTFDTIDEFAKAYYQLSQAILKDGFRVESPPVIQKSPTGEFVEIKVMGVEFRLRCAQRIALENGKSAGAAHCQYEFFDAPRVPVSIRA